MATAFKHVVRQNLECPVCLGFFKEPKILSCSHTFCKGCLETLHESRANKDKLPCPLCREETSISGGDVSTLQTNITVRAQVADMKTQAQVCANCDPTLAVAYCNECGISLCETCREIHSKWAMFSGHSIVAASDILSGKIHVKRRGKCQKHPNEDECFCLDCGKYICFRCGMLEHAHEGHKIVPAEMHETEQKKTIDQMTSKAEAKVHDLDKYITFVEDQCERLQKLESQLTTDIDEAFEEAVHKLTERKTLLKREVGQQIKELATMLIDMKEKGRRQIVQVNAVCGLVKNGLKVPLQKEALTTHETLCQELEELLGGIEHDDDHPRRIVEEGQHIHFQRSQGSDGLELGQVRKGDPKWILHAERQLPTRNSMQTLALSPNNGMAVGCKTGGIFVYSNDGILQETLLKTQIVRGLHFMRDGSYVTRDDQNRIALYTSQNEKRDVKFKTPSYEEGGYGGLTVEKEGHILSSYKDKRTIRIFQPVGGKAVREIPCGELVPMQIFAMNSSKMIVVKSGYTVCIIDGVSGTNIHSITKDGEFAYPAVSNDDSVIIAWVKDYQGLLSIGQYTNELKHIKDLLTDFKITKPSRLWYHLRHFKTGEIAFCTPDRLYIFRETCEV